MTDISDSKWTENASETAGLGSFRSFPNLPSEVRIRIIQFHLQSLSFCIGTRGWDSELRSMALVGSEWQHEVDETIFNQIHQWIAPDLLYMDRAAVGNRLRQLRRMNYEIKVTDEQVFRTVGMEYTGQLHSLEQVTKNAKKVFSNIFTVLERRNSAPSTAENSVNIFYRLYSSCWKVDDELKHLLGDSTQWLGLDLDFNELPLLHSVRNAGFYEYPKYEQHIFNLSSRSQISLICCLPALEKYHWRVQQAVSHAAADHEDNVEALAKAICAAGPRITTLEVTRVHNTFTGFRLRRNTSWLPSLCNEHYKEEQPFNIQTSHFMFRGRLAWGNQLTSLRLTSVIDATQFLAWCTEHDTAVWPKLKELDIVAGGIENRTKELVSRETMEGFSNAIGRMPALNSATLQHNSTSGYDRTWLQFVYKDSRTASEKEFKTGIKRFYRRDSTVVRMPLFICLSGTRVAWTFVSGLAEPLQLAVKDARGLRPCVGWEHFSSGWQMVLGDVEEGFYLYDGQEESKELKGT